MNTKRIRKTLDKRAQRERQRNTILRLGLLYKGKVMTSAEPVITRLEQLSDADFQKVRMILKSVERISND